VAAALTEQPGSSDYFLGGVVSYANDAKMQVLGVDQATLEAHGAVSPEVARQMAEGARGLFGADVAVSVTGIAGPDAQGSKPVGLTYIAASRPDQTVVREFNWDGDRAANRVASVEAALNLATEILS
jgi:PncC family amidohydrolase